MATSKYMNYELNTKCKMWSTRKLICWKHEVKNILNSFMMKTLSSKNQSIDLQGNYDKDHRHEKAERVKFNIKFLSQETPSRYLPVQS